MAEPAQKGFILFNKILSCFSEIIDKNHKSYSQSASTGEKLNPYLYLEPNPSAHQHSQNQRTRT